MPLSLLLFSFDYFKRLQIDLIKKVRLTLLDWSLFPAGLYLAVKHCHIRQ